MTRSIIASVLAAAIGGGLGPFVGGFIGEGILYDIIASAAIALIFVFILSALFKKR